MYFKEHIPILRRDNLCNLSEGLVTEIKTLSRAFTDLQIRALTSLIHAALILICFSLILLML